MTLASAVPEIPIRAPKFKIGHVTATTPILRVICHPHAGTWHSFLVFKVDHSSFSRSRDMVAAPKM